VTRHKGTGINKYVDLSCGVSRGCFAGMCCPIFRGRKHQGHGPNLVADKIGDWTKLGFLVSNENFQVLLDLLQHLASAREITKLG